MAEIMYGAVGNILSNLASDAWQELGEICGANEELKKLQDTLGTVKAFLVDAEQAAERSKLVKDWISRLEDVVYDADDLLDEFHYEHLRQKAHSAERVTQVHNLFSSLTKLPDNLTMHTKVKEIRERLDEVTADMAKFKFRERVITDMGIGNSWRETDSSVVKIIGRNENKEDIINLLIEPQTSDEVNVSIVGIVGIGGLGKTALAQLVYNEARIKSHFSQKFWVCVSEEFDTKLLIKKILKSVPGKEEIVDKLDLEQLQGHLREVLGGKRYLIVLDDVWNENSLRWEGFSDYLVHGAPGSKILVTTRNRSVLLAMGINSTYVLEGLNSDQSWDLFKHVVSFRGQNKIDTKLELIGKEVVERCRGVPLAIKTLGSLMRQNPNEKFWSSIKEDHEAWRTSLETEGGILPVLKLSYNHLPSHLRPCFAFCSIFPKDFILRKDWLIQLWNAQGYIQPSIRNQRSVDLGDQYYNDLLSRSFFQEEDRYGNATCKMHDLIHDLAQLVAGSSFYTVKDDKEKIPKNVRHLFLECNPSQKFPKIPIKGIRTILRYYNIGVREVFQIQSLNLSCSRVLDLNNAHIKMLPNEIGKLKLLRFLDLTGNPIKVVPDFITNLHNLQTLLLVACQNLKQLPKDISKLISLECLSIEGCNELKYLPKGLGELTSLQSLKKFIVNSDEEDSATLNELRDLNYLGGKLVIENLDMVRNVELESNEANLKEKKHLESLTFEWRYRQDIDNKKKEDLLLDNLEPHPNLKKLLIYGYRGTRLSSWLSSLTNLVELRIKGAYNCRCQQLPRLDHLQFLESLTLDNLSALEYVADDDGIGKATMFFPSLKKLDISSCPNLKGWWRKNENEGATSELPCFPCLSSLIIWNCPNLTSMPLFPSLEDLDLKFASIRPLQQTLMMKTNNTSTASASSGSSSTAPPLSNLKKLNLEHIHYVETLPGLDHLPSLEILTLGNLSALEYAANDPTSSLSCSTSTTTSMFFPKLKELELSDCENLKGWWRKNENEGATSELPCFPCLSSLRIVDCPNLTSMPLFPCLDKKLVLSNASIRPLQQTLMMKTNNTSTASASSSSSSRSSSTAPPLSNLKELILDRIDDVETLPEEFLLNPTSLEYLEFEECNNKLASLAPRSTHCLPSLKELWLFFCPELTTLPEWISTLTSLRTLAIGNCSQLQSMPGGICGLTSLEELVFDRCDNLTALTEWIPELTSLKFLQIGYCPLLLSLPGGMHRLTSLRELMIKECPQLAETCKEESGTDWPQIAQIPNICIDDRWVRGKNETKNAYRFEYLGL